MAKVKPRLDVQDEPVADEEGGRLTLDLPKLRRCLRCATTFQSEWSGERVCARCKSTRDWRDGISLKSYSSNGRS